MVTGEITHMGKTRVSIESIDGDYLRMGIQEGMSEVEGTRAAVNILQHIHIL